MATKQYSQLRAFMRAVSAVVSLACSLAAIPLVWLLVVRLGEGDYVGAIAPGLGTLALLLFILIWFVLAAVVGVLLSSARELGQLSRAVRADADRQSRLFGDLGDRIEGLAHWTAMSEPTRALLVRKRELDVFARQVEAAIDDSDWDEADRLIAMFQDHFKDEARADELRGRLGNARKRAADRSVRGRISEIRELIDEENFPAAEMALNRLAGEYPEDGRLADLRTTCQRARRRYVESAQQKFRGLLVAGQVEDAAGVIDGLSLVEPELVEELRGEWKDVFRQVQKTAREQFRQSVREKKWEQALAQGERILSRFPDKPLAGEVRRVIDTVRERAAESTAGAEGGTAQR